MIAERVVAAIPSSIMAVPASLHASLMAQVRSARFGEGGRADWSGDRTRILSRSAGHGGRTNRMRNWQSALDRLVEAGLLFRQGVPPHATYLFKHALVRTRHTARCCVSRDARCTLVSQKASRASSPR